MPKKQLEPNEKTNLVLRIGNKIPFSGLICALLAGLSFTFGKLLVKQVETIHPTVNILLRGFFTFCFYAPIVMSKKNLSFFGENRAQFYALCGRGFFGFLVSITSYTALWCIPLGDSITLLLTATVFTSIFARIFLKEDFTLINLFFILLTMVGVVLIAEPPFLFKYGVETYSFNKFIGIILSLIAAVSFAFSYVILRYLKGVHVDLIVFYFGIFTFFGTLICLPFIKHFTDNPETIKLPETQREWLYSLLISVCGICGEFFLTSAFQLEKASYIAILRCGDIVMAYLVEMAFLPKEIIKWNSIVGAAIILGCVVLTTISKAASSNDDKDSVGKDEITIISNDQKC